MKISRLYCLLLLAFLACNKGVPKKENALKDSVRAVMPTPAASEHISTIETGTTTPAELVSFAQTLKGTPYKYGSTDPKEGFDCSGFVTYVFNHFGIKVPRTSVDFNGVQKPISIKDAKPGDLVLFTGTDSTVRTVGHMGIIVSATKGEVTFIHATSGRKYQVTETPMNIDYKNRYMKTIRIFPQNNGH